MNSLIHLTTLKIHLILQIQQSLMKITHMEITLMEYPCGNNPPGTNQTRQRRNHQPKDDFSASQMQDFLEYIYMGLNKTS